jgi:hypothetical protein
VEALASNRATDRSGHTPANVGRLSARAAAVLAGLALLALWIPAASAAPIPRTPVTSWQTNGRVRAVEFSADGKTVFIAGSFTAVRPPGASAGTQEVTRNNAAAFNVATNTLLPWNPNVNNTVWGMGLSPDGSKVYLGGDFTTAQGASRNHFAAVDASSGTPLAGTANVNARVEAVLASPDGTRVYIGGLFHKVSGATHNLVAALTASGSLVSTFKASVTQYATATCPPRCSPVVASLALSGTRLYIGGHFGLLDGVGRDNVGAVDASTGTSVSSYDASVFHTTTNQNQKNMVYQILPYGTHVYLCGDFYYVDGVVAPNIASTLSSDGSLDTSFHGSTDGGTPACAISGSLLYVGGHFILVDGTARNHIAAVDLTTGALDSWNPSANSNRGLHDFDTWGTGSSFELGAGGDFTKIGGVYQQGFARFVAS